MIVFPVAPSLGRDVLAQRAVHEQSVCVCAPGAAEIHLSDAGVSGQSAVVEDVAVLHILRR